MRTKGQYGFGYILMYGVAILLISTSIILLYSAMPNLPRSSNLCVINPSQPLVCELTTGMQHQTYATAILVFQLFNTLHDPVDIDVSMDQAWYDTQCTRATVAGFLDAEEPVATIINSNNKMILEEFTLEPMNIPARRKGYLVIFCPDVSASSQIEFTGSLSLQFQPSDASFPRSVDLAFSRVDVSPTSPKIEISFT